jgi:hypothetical protein
VLAFGKILRRSIPQESKVVCFLIPARQKQAPQGACFHLCPLTNLIIKELNENKVKLVQKEARDLLNLVKMEHSIRT